MNTFDDVLLDAYAHTFYGYRNYNGAYWFIGIEERSDTFQDIERRLLVWDSRGRRELDDLASFYKEIGYTYLFEKQPKLAKSPKLQPTWNKLIRLLLSSDNRLWGYEYPEESLEMVRGYQKNLLGRLSGETCLINFLPLPSPTLEDQDWVYVNYSALDYCISRNAYEYHFMPLRVKRIKELIVQHKPQVVVFYSANTRYLPCWKQIADVPFSYDDFDDVSIAQNETTTFVIVKHPVTKGLTRSYFHNIGKLIVYKRTMLLRSGKLE